MGSSPDADGDGVIQGHTQPQADRETQLADARLIAAAPELYDALGAMALTAKALINSLEGAGPAPLHMIEAGIREIRAALEMADKATRKAEGRE